MYLMGNITKNERVMETRVIPRNSSKIFSSCITNKQREQKKKGLIKEITSKIPKANTKIHQCQRKTKD